jgi:transposase-like protein
MITLQAAADYITTSRASAALKTILASVKRIIDFRVERANRLTRFIAITRAYKSGEAVTAIAARYGCDKTTVLRYARMAGLPKRPKHFAADVRTEVIRDYRDRRLSVKQIAERNSVSAAYVSKIARAEGISRYNGARGTWRRKTSERPTT